MATLLAHIKVKPGMASRFEDISRKLYAESHAKETRILRYEYFRGAEPDTFYTLLSFDSFVGFLEHQTSDHHEIAAPSIGEVVEAIKLEWVDPLQGGSPLPPTNNEAVAADAAELTKRYAERYAPHVADWWLAQR